MSASEKLKALKPEGLVVTDAPYEGYTDAVCLPIPAHASVVAVVEAAERALQELDDAIKANVNGCDWEQEDYDGWDAARTASEQALAALEQALTNPQGKD